MSDIDNIINNFKTLGTKFQGLEKKSTDPIIWDAIYENKLYTINKHMLEAYFARRDFWKKSYTYISSKPKIKQYIDENIEEYMDLILNNVPIDGGKNYFNDDEKLVIDLLNNPKITDRQKHSYLSKMKTCIGDIYAIKDINLWDALLLNIKLPQSEETILKYFFYIDDEHRVEKYNVLLDFINKIPDLTKLDFVNIDWSKYTDIKYDFYKLIISSEKLNPPAESIVASAFDLQYELSEFPNLIRNEYLKIMIKNDILSVSRANSQKMIDAYPTLLGEFIQKNSAAFCKLLNAGALEMPEETIQQLLYESDSTTTDDVKLKLAKSYRGRIRCKVQFSDEILLEILQNHLYDTDLARFFKMYDETNDSNVKSIILDACKNNDFIGDFEKELSEKHYDLYFLLESAGCFVNRDIKYHNNNDF